MQKPGPQILLQPTISVSENVFIDFIDVKCHRSAVFFTQTLCTPQRCAFLSSPKTSKIDWSSDLD